VNSVQSIIRSLKLRGCFDLAKELVLCSSTSVEVDNRPVSLGDINNELKYIDDLIPK